MNFIKQIIKNLSEPIVRQVAKQEINSRIQKAIDAEVKIKVEAEVKHRVKAEVEAMLKSTIRNMKPEERLKLQSAPNSDLMGMIEILKNPKIELTDMEMEIVGKTDLDTYVRYKKKWKENSISAMVKNFSDTNLHKLEPMLVEKGFEFYTDLDIRVRFEYKGESTSKIFYIIDTATDIRSVKSQIRRVRDTITDQLPEYIV